MTGMEIERGSTSTVEAPTHETETREKDELDIPWQVVVHNDPVNLMTYVTMVFQGCLVIRAKKPSGICSKSINRAAPSCGAACANERNFTSSSFTVICFWRRSRKSFDMEICRRVKRSRFRISIPFWPSFCGKSRQARIPKATRKPKQRLFSRPSSREREFARSGRFTSNRNCADFFAAQPRPWPTIWRN